jgi:kynureninase
MPSSFDPIPGAQGYQHSNPPLLSMIPLIATLRTIDTAGGPANLRARSILLTSYLLELLKTSKYWGSGFRVLTPEREDERGAQLSVAFGTDGDGGRMRRVFGRLVRKGVMGDEREPEVIRFA